MKSKHTPGPWLFDHDAGEIYGRQEDGEPVVVYSGGMQFYSDGDLIAAAPEMYEALFDIVKRSPFVPSEGGITVTISLEQMKLHQAALRKAEGKQ